MFNEFCDGCIDRIECLVHGHHCSRRWYIEAKRREQSADQERFAWGCLVVAVMLFICLVY